MHEILRNLPSGARVLDLGALSGSFDISCCPSAFTVRVDLERPDGGTTGAFVQADAGRLPFRDDSFDALIANHSLEHIEGLSWALTEMGRVIRARGGMFVSVPDASTFSDKLFRWIYRERSGHINPFYDIADIADRISSATGLELVAVRVLYSSFEYLNRYYFGKRTSWRLRLLGNGARRSIIMLSYITRLIDRGFGTRLSIYGWALYFGNIGEVVDQRPRRNVCVGCGAGHDSAWLSACRLVRRRFLVFSYYSCPSCGSKNLFIADPQAGG